MFLIKFLKGELIDLRPFSNSNLIQNHTCVYMHIDLELSVH